MAGLLVTVSAPPDLRRRFELASGADPLDRLAPHARAELEQILGRTRDFADLPGKWQAALLRAEAAHGGAPLPQGGGCCSGAPG